MTDDPASSSDPTLDAIQIGPYQLRSKLGQGGLGEVFEGFDERLHRTVALKRLKSGGDDPDGRRRFQREARAIARLNHPAIVQVHDWIEQDDEAWIVMELVKGQSLRQRMGQALSLHQTLALADDILAGLGAAHGEGIVHRDLKPENVMVTDSGRAKILDFGLAKQRRFTGHDSELTADGQILGTVTAMSPEQALGREVDHRSDLFSFGTLLYEMVTGISPFRSDSPVETLARICTQQQTPAFTLQPSVPEPLSALIDQLLKKDPSLRPGGAEETRLALGALEVEATSGRQTGLDAGPGMAVDQETLDTSALALTSGGAAPGLGRLAGNDRFGNNEVTTDQLSSGSNAADRPSAQLTTVASMPESQDPLKDNRVKPIATSYGPTSYFIVALVLAGILAAALYFLGPTDSARSAQNLAEATPESSSLQDLDELQLLNLSYRLLNRFDKKDNIERSIEALQRLLGLNPSSAPGHAALALAYGYYSQTESKDPDWMNKAEAVAERAVELDPFLAKARISRGFVYGELGRWNDAVDDLNTALELDPASVDVRLGLARIHEAKGELADAEAVLKEAIELQPVAWMLHFKLGSVLYRGGRFEPARDSFQQAVELAPDSALAFRNLSAAYYALGNLAKASTVLQQALEIEPKATLYGNLGAFYFIQGLYPQAVQAFDRALSLDGATHDYRMWANLADAYRWTPGRRGEAANAYVRALQLLSAKLAERPDDVVLKSRRTLYLAKKDDCPKALAELQALDDIPQNDGATFYRTAVALEICQQRSRAFEALDRAVDAGYPKAEIQGDPELRLLREDSRYHKLIAEPTS